MLSKGNITRSIPVDVSAADFEDTRGFFIRSGAGNIRYSTMGSAHAVTVSRKIDTNVATIGCLAPHGLNVGEVVVVAGMDESDYDGVHTVTAVSTDGKSFSFALTHADEAETSDDKGTVDAAILKTVEAQVYFVDPEVVRKIYSTGTTATGIYVGYGVV